MKFTAALLALAISTGLASAEDQVTTKPQQHEGWVDLLEKDPQGDFGLKHWKMGNVAPNTFSFKKDKDGEEVLVCTGKPTGVIRTAQIYENCLVEFEWRHMEREGMRANAGFFIWSDALPSVAIPFSRSVEVQVCNFDNNTDWYTRHGDVFAIHGATMTPDPRFAVWVRGQRSCPLDFRAKETGEWNHYRILCVDGTIQLEVNGKVVSGGYHINPRKGHLMIESEGGEVHFRNMRVLELKPDPKGLEANQIANVLPAEVNVRPLYNGLDLDSWKLSEGAKFRAADSRMIAIEGEASYPLDAGEGKLIVDFYNDAELEALPVKMEVKGMTGKVAKGAHRFEVDLKSGQWTLDGTAKDSILKPVNGTLTLSGLGKKGYYANVLIVK